MAFVYTFINFLLIFLSVKIYSNRLLNPISIYSFVWVFIVILYELKLVLYYPLTMTTWFIIITFQLTYSLGCIIGRYIVFKKTTYKKTVSPSYELFEKNEKYDLSFTIVILSLLTSISTLSNLTIAIQHYGFNLLQYTNQLYSSRITGSIDNGVPYLGAIVYPALIFAGRYYKKFGYSHVILLPVFLLLLGSLKTGGRLGIFMGAFLFVIPIIIEKLKKNKEIKIRWQAMKVSFPILLMIFILWQITDNRSTGVYVSSAITTSMSWLIEIHPAIYKIYVYLSGPLGVLNVFLANPNFNFGGHTFLPLYSFLEKIGLNIDVQDYQQFYRVPIEVNVGTYIRELIEDFTVPMALFVVLIFGFVLSYNFLQFFRTKNNINLVWFSMLSFVTFFSFFMWNIRSSDVWITLLVGSLVALILDERKKRRLLRS